ncbi:MAG: tetratricopeptide repeat protein [Myxococcales bacterium]|nr:tetratricopeptide repeat protein [Myxococcales bacterium]
MLKVDTTLSHIPARREHVVGLFESINQPLVNIPGHGTAPTYAFILGTRNDQGHFTVFVYLWQKESGAVVIYVSEPRALDRDGYRAEEEEALRFVESMGFLVDNVHFATLPPHEQDSVMARIPLFRPPMRVPDPFLPGPGGQGAPTGLASLDTNALFGGLSDADSELFRRAGVSGRPEPMMGRAPDPGPPPAPTSGTSAEAEAPPLDEDARRRLGRLLAMFGVLATVGLGASACTTTSSGGGQEGDSRTVESHVDLGNQQLARGLWVDAIRTFDLVIEEDEGHRDALRGLGLAYLNLGRLDEAEGYYRRAVAADAKWSMPKNELAVVLIERGQCAEAEKLLEQVLKDIFYVTPEYAEHNLARALACQGRLAEAEKRLDNLLLKRPYFCLGYLTLAQVSQDAKHPETTIQACEDFSKNCEQNEQIREQVSPEHSAQCHLRAGLAYAALGDVESARAAFLRCNSSGPNGRECKRSLELLPP